MLNDLPGDVQLNLWQSVLLPIINIQVIVNDEVRSCAVTC